MNTRRLAATAFGILAAAFFTWCALVGAGQGRDASAPTQGPSATPRPPRTPKGPRANKDVRQERRPTRRFVTVTVISNLPNCNVLIDGEPEERGTDEQGRVSIPMEPGTYDVSLTNPGYVTEGREVEVKAVPPYRQEERFVLRRALLSLQVKTNPAGVKVKLDGNMEGESDADGLLTFKEVDPSVQHTLHATKEDYHEETVTVLPYKREASVRLARDVLNLKVKTYPPQAEVFLDDETKGVSDADGVLLIHKVKTDKEHTLRASKEGYVTQTATVPPNYELSVITLPPVGEAPTPSVRRTSPEAQGSPDGQQEAKERGGSAPQTSDTPQGLAATPGVVAPHAPQEEGRPPSSQKSEEHALSFDVEITFWNTIKDSKNPEEFAAYIRKYPQGQFVELARIRMNALLADRPGHDDSTAATPGAEPSRPTPTPTPTPAPVSTPTPAQPFAAGPQPEPAVAHDQPLEETLDWLKKHFASKFTYTYTEARPARVPSSQNASVQVEPLSFEGCRLEWRVFDDVHRVSLSDLDPADIKVVLRAAPGTTYSINVWSVTLVGAAGKEAFEKLEGGRGDSPKKYWRLVLLYDGKEKADGVAAAFERAIGLCGGKAQR